jgi:cholesterol 7-desaturase
MVEQYERDVVIFHNKIFMHKPLLTKEDALIAKYRKWFTQFYSESSAKVHKNSANAFEW